MQHDSHQMDTCHVGIYQILPILKLWYSNFTERRDRRNENVELRKHKVDVLHQVMHQVNQMNRNRSIVMLMT